MDNGSILENIDFIEHCTGYKYSYPFLQESDKFIEFYNKETK